MDSPLHYGHSTPLHQRHLQEGLGEDGGIYIQYPHHSGHAHFSLLAWDSRFRCLKSHTIRLRHCYFPPTIRLLNQPAHPNPTYLRNTMFTSCTTIDWCFVVPNCVLCLVFFLKASFEMFYAIYVQCVYLTVSMCLCCCCKIVIVFISHGTSTCDRLDQTNHWLYVSCE